MTSRREFMKQMSTAAAAVGVGGGLGYRAIAPAGDGGDVSYEHLEDGHDGFDAPASSPTMPFDYDAQDLVDALVERGMTRLDFTSDMLALDPVDGYRRWGQGPFSINVEATYGSVEQLVDAWGIGRSEIRPGR